jgi:hypothetical protein
VKISKQLLLPLVAPPPSAFSPVHGSFVPQLEALWKATKKDPEKRRGASVQAFLVTPPQIEGELGGFCNPGARANIPEFPKSTQIDGNDANRLPGIGVVAFWLLIPRILLSQKSVLT